MPMSGYIYLKLITLPLVAGIGWSVSISCPDVCICHWELDSLIVDCSNRGLTEFPFIEEGFPVEHLDLSHNYFKEFPTHYSRIDSLIFLDLSNNEIQEITDDALVGFETLRVLILANNSIQSWSDINPNIAFQHAYSLQKLSLSGNHLERFSDAEGAPLLVSDLLTELDLSNCGITQVNNVLSGLPRLQKLILSGNTLNTLNSLPSKSLRALDVSNCSLTWVNRSLIDSLPSLEILNLSWNPGVLQGSKRGEVVEWESLLHIDLSFCSLCSLDLSGMPNLKTARLKGNMLRSISGTLFEKNTALELLDLSRNTIRQLDDTAFSALLRLINLDLSNNDIIRIDRNQFRNNSALVSINMSRNVLKTFVGFISNSLRNVDLSWCEILEIDPSAFTGFKRLINLDLSHNFLTKFPPNMRSETLRKLDLSMCRLLTISNTTFSGFPELTSLKLSGNRFTNPFRPEYFKSNTFLNEIWLDDNSWNCDCNDSTLKEFYDYLTRPEKIKDRLKCRSPSEYSGKNWQNVCLKAWYIKIINRSSAWYIILIFLLIILPILSFLMFWLWKSSWCKIKRSSISHDSHHQNNFGKVQEISLYPRPIEQNAQQNSPIPSQSILISSENTSLMPKLDSAHKSLTDLSSKRKPLPRAKTDVKLNETEEEPILDQHRYSIQEMLSDRDNERNAVLEIFRRTGRIDHNSSETHPLSMGDFAKRFQSLRGASAGDSVAFLSESGYNSKTESLSFLGSS